MRIYYGWIVAAICGVIMLLVMGSTVAVYGLYVLPVAEEFGLNRADVNTAFVIANLGGAIQAPFIGRLADTIPLRRMMVIGALCFSGSMIVISLSNNVWISAGMLAVAMPWAIGGLGTVCCMAMIARWFQAQRARAMAIAIMGMSLGSVILSPVVGSLIEAIGWRHCVMLVGTAVGGLFLVLIWFLRERPGPEDIEPLPAGAAAAPVQMAQPSDARAMSTKQILRLPLFWALAFGMALFMGVSQAISITLVPLAQEGGIGVTASAGLLSVMGLGSIAGKFVLVWIGDRFEKALASAILLALFAVVIVAVPIANNYLLLAIFAALLGLAGGALMPLCMALLADYVGANSFGSANGLATLLIAISGAATMRASGEIYDRTGGYGMLFLILSIIVVAASVLLVMCWRLSRAKLKQAAA